MNATKRTDFSPAERINVACNAGLLGREMAYLCIQMDDLMRTYNGEYLYSWQRRIGDRWGKLCRVVERRLQAQTRGNARLMREHYTTAAAYWLECQVLPEDDHERILAMALSPL